jgi:acylphosphatase
MSAKVDLHCIVTGRVQGVNYRNFVKSIATDMGLTGFVANLPDGSVEVLAQGDLSLLKVLQNHLRTGPAGAKVHTVYEEFSEAGKRFEDFSVT